MRFEFSTSNRILFGSGLISEVPALAASLGQRVFIVTSSLERCTPLREALLAMGLSLEFIMVKEEPNLDSIILATRNMQEFNCQVVIASAAFCAGHRKSCCRPYCESW